jgi:hypothetical protein
VPATLSQQGGGAGGTLSREVPEWLGAAPTKLHAEHVSQEGPLWVPPILVQRQWSVLDDTLHDEGGAEALDAWEGGEAVVLDLLGRRAGRR